ncbi:MAG: AAA family ATPase [Bacteroidales bacterium]|nr:AAA family ATPase [Bacteroidales bacterium]
MTEDIFHVSDPAEHTLKLYIRYNDRAQTKFDNANKVKLEEVVRVLSNGEWPCYLSKRDQDEILVSIPLTNPAGQADLVLSYNEAKHCFTLEVAHAKKTKFRSGVSLPDPQYSFPAKAQFFFLSPEENFNDFQAMSEMLDLKQKVAAMEVPPGMSIEIQQEIWTEYVEAQSQIVDSLNEPFFLEGEPRLSEEKRENGDGIYRYRLDLRLPAKDTNEYFPLKSALQEELSIETDIDNDGNSVMRLDDIYRGIDTIISKKFPDRYERDATIGCVVMVRPIPAADRIAEKLGDVAKFSQRGAFVVASDLAVPFETLSARLHQEGYSPASMSVLFHIKNVQNLWKSPHVDKYGITFSEDRSFKRIGTEYNQKEICLPEPNSATTFLIEMGIGENMHNRYAFLENTLKYIYGAENVEKNVQYRFRPDSEVVTEGFTKDEWDDIWRDVYALDYKYNAAPSEGGMFLSFDFESKEELETAISGLESIGKFQIFKSPRDDDFQFKVKIHLTAKKTEKEIFLEKLKKLNGVDFVFDFTPDVDDENIRKRRVPIYVGKLNGYESTSDHLVLNLPYMFKEDVKQTDQFLKFWKANGSKIDSVHANLIGDRSKLNWLQDAISKLGTGAAIKGPNSVPVNDKIREFIFDTSKAEPVFRYENTDIEETPEFKEFDKTSVLTLNDSQKKAVLKGVEARDLCMLQGPPGTGKTTVIAELIWQHIRKDQNTRLLLTSETNLAVDNALEKLMNEKAANPAMSGYLTLIKPLRFGKPEKFEEEGKRYSIERIEKWIDDTASVEDDYESEVLSEEAALQDDDDAVVVDVNDNIVQHWMRRIADRSKAGDPRYAEVLKDWTMGLAMPDKATKIQFRDLYYSHVNVVGSTCSSTGSPGFLMEYLRTFKGLRSEDFRTVKTNLNRWRHGTLNDRGTVDLAVLFGVDDQLSISDMQQAVKDICTINFDTVIMDEASKATPPELLMPLCFGRKSIVIGDHRQLPPMLNEKSFKEALLDLNSKKAESLAEEIDRDFVDTSQFKRMILNKQVSPTIKSTFNEQYRMHPAINDVISQFYEDDESGGLHCGLDPKRVDSPDLSDPQSRYHGFYQKGFIAPDVHTIWVNVDAPEESDGTSKINIKEITAINKVLEKLSTADGFKEYMAHWDTLK